ncbi:hypothetical protein ACFL45_02555 [Candidatus Neomarinimicrobiota bacterium]
MRLRIFYIWISMVISIGPVCGILLAQDLKSGSTDYVSPAGGRLGLEASAGLHGSLSFMEVGALWPLKEGKMFLGLRAKTMSSITWATFIDLEDGETASFHPVVVGGALTVGGASPLLHGFLKAHGGMDILLGYSFTPYDNMVYGTGNLIGDNLTFAYYGFFGFEMYTSSRLAIFLDAGGGFKSLVGDEENVYVIASSWLGSGVGLRMGMTFYP